MKKLWTAAWLTSVAGVLLLAGSVMGADPAEPTVAAKKPEAIGYIVAINGQATVLRKEKNHILKMKAPIYLRDKITTDEGCNIQILFIDDSIVSQGGKSEMFIDEYVFNPRVKKSNACGMKFIKGIFRIVTGKIIEMNPKRFRVRTRMATIGIRGCDIAFWISEALEKVYVIRLHGHERLDITTHGLGRRGWQAFARGLLRRPEIQPRTIQIRNSGALVDIAPDRGLTQRRVRPLEAMELMQQLNFDGRAPAAAPLPRPLPRVLPGLLLPLLPPPPPPPVLNTSSLPPPPPVGGEVASAPTFVLRGGGPDWRWGIWETDGVLNSVAFLSDNMMPAAQFQSIVNGTTFYALNGNGVAAAVLRHAAARRLVTGSTTLSVYVGDQTLPSWNGAFDMANTAGDELHFVAAGTMTPEGRLSGNSLSYRMRVNGSDFQGNTLTLEVIEGRLIGPGAAGPITGSVGEFHFSHNGVATADGGWGLNF